MRLYRFWARHRAQGVDRVSGRVPFEIYRTARGFSNISVEDALRVARERAERSIAFSLDPVHKAHGDFYYDRPICEEIVRELSEGEDVYAIVSRNSYGCLVLNTSDVFFADIDIPNPNASGLFSRLFGKSPRPFEETLIEKIEGFVRLNGEHGLRLYRTLKGYRLVITDRAIPTSNSQAMNLLKSFGSDRLYVSLCRSQDCYRARLTPKPWRCGVARPTIPYPFETPQVEAEFRAWQTRYDVATPGYATCALVGDFGSEWTHPRVREVLALHDQYVLNGDRPLA